MKKIVFILAFVVCGLTVNAQNYFLGGGFDLNIAVNPDGTTENMCELVVAGQLDHLDLMVGFGLFDEPENVDHLYIGVYNGYNIDRFTFGGYLGYELTETTYTYSYPNYYLGSGNSYYSVHSQKDMFMVGAYIKYALFEHFKLFAFYKLGYDTDRSLKWVDKGFGIGVTIGFAGER